MTVRLIEIPQDSPGFNQFIGSWAHLGNINFIVDVGPANTSTRLTDTLVSLGIDRLDYILLTHIHIDHAGGLSNVLEHYPMARVICHEKAIPFLVNPSKLWSGSLSVLGKTALIYGKPKPVEEKRFMPHSQCNIAGLTIVETPGHAAHHLSFSYGNRLFAGEAAGNYLVLTDGTYLRPATPPLFFMAAYLDSLKRLLAIGNKILCYGHFGEAPNSHEMLDRFNVQLHRWKEIIIEALVKGEKDPLPGCMKALIEEDPELKLFNKLSPSVQDREKFFLSNSINGYIKFLQKEQPF
jgi:glyoxylase-like metal-dependent hydrolase (beta-lactamase superfamily II)